MKMPGASLAGLRVLTLRSARPDDPLTETLQLAGATVANYPVLNIEGLDVSPETIVKLRPSEVGASTLLPYDTLVFVSRHAVFHGLESLRRAGIDFTKVRVVAVGPTTGAILRSSGIESIYPIEQASTESVLAMSEMQTVRGQRILIVRGQSGRETLKQELLERGAEVRYCEVYRRIVDYRHADAIRKFLDNHQSTAVVVHSGEIVSAYAGLLTSMHSDHFKLQPVLDLPCITPGIRVAQIAGELGFTQVISASSALAVDIEQALRCWYTR